MQFVLCVPDQVEHVQDGVLCFLGCTQFQAYAVYSSVDAEAVQEADCHRWMEAASSPAPTDW